MAEWFVAAKKADFAAIGKRFSISPMLARIIRNRDIIEETDIDLFLNGGVGKLPSPYLLRDVKKAANILQKKINDGKTIRVIGDYDIDGVCATHILVTGLRICGANISYAIPNRMTDGYGLNEYLIKAAHKDGVDTIVTCDNGIAAEDAIAYAKSLSMTVILTDHHEVPFDEINGVKQYRLPIADAIVNPKQENCEYPCKNICGALVAYKLVQVLYDICEIEKERQEDILEFAAFATIGDVMELLLENRIVVKYGLEVMKHTKNIGLRALIETTKIIPERITPYHIGYILGPCLNATGRLDTAERAMRLLETEDAAEAVLIAGDLKALNDNRKELTEKGVKEAIRIIEETALLEDHVLVVYLSKCHESIAGIIAGRLRERYHKPIFVLTKAEEGVKGSGRSIEAYHMYEEMTKCKELFSKYGGHKMAAGLSMDSEEKINSFRTKINEYSALTKEDLTEKIHIDIPMPLMYVTDSFIQELNLLEPFGAGNTKPLFACKNISFVSGKIVGKNKNVAKFSLQDENKSRYDAIYFGDIEGFCNYVSEQFGDDARADLFGKGADGIVMSIVYYPEFNEYMGKKTKQITLRYYKK